MNDWKKFSISGKKNEDPRYLEMSDVFHVAHIDTALNIIKEGKIQKRYVSDESILTRKIEVIWLSCNDWNVKGYIYGTVRFHFDFKTAFKNKKFYWVEAMEKYNPTACRIFISKKNIQKLNLDITLEELDINSDLTPLKYDKDEDKYYWNSKFTMEFMFDEDIKIDENITIDFVKHDTMYSCKKKDCNELNILQEESALRLFSKLIREGVSIVGLNFTSGSKNAVRQNIDLLSNEFCSYFDSKSNGILIKDNAASIHVMYAILEERYRGNKKACKQLINLFNSIEDIKKVYSKTWLKVYKRDVLLLGESKKEYKFKALPIYTQIEKQFVYILCKLKSKSHWVDYHLIGETSDLSESIYIYNLEKTNGILLLPEDNKEERERIIADILENKNYTSLKTAR